MIFQPNVCTTQKRWRLATYHKSEETERSFVSSPLQDGEYIESKRCIKERGLHGQIRPDRCILNSFCVPRESKIPKIFISRKKFPVFLSPIRPSNSSESFHKDSATSSNISQINWDQTINLFRRYFDSGQFPDIDDRPFPDNLRSYTEFGLSSQLEEECNKTHSTDRVCWSIGRFRINDSEHTQIQDSEDCQGESSDHQETDAIWMRACSDYGPANISHPGSPLRSSPLSIIAETETSSCPSSWVPRWSCFSQRRSDERFTLLDRDSSIPEWERNQSSFSPSYNLNGCFSDRLGGQSRRQVSRWT
jgi:hypothetical protein